MAYFNAAASKVGVDMGSTAVFYGAVTTATSQKLTVAAGFNRQDYVGSFTYPNNSIAGTLTGTTYSNSSTGATYNVYGFSVDAGTAASYITSGNIQPLVKSVLSRADSIFGSAGKDRLFGYGGNDQLVGLAGDDYISGGDGVDTAVFIRNRADYNFSATSGFVAIYDPMGIEGLDELVDVERISFSDMSVAFDVEGSAGQAYRLYQAAFGRAPDRGGLGSWITWLDQGNALQNAASFFQTTPEFASKYGTNVTADQFVRLLYENVLHRTPDIGGYLDWMGRLNLGQQTRAEVLVGFSESAENKAALIGVMQIGMEFTVGQ